MKQFELNRKFQGHTLARGHVELSVSHVLVNLMEKKSKQNPPNKP